MPSTTGYMLRALFKQAYNLVQTEARSGDGEEEKRNHQSGITTGEMMLFHQERQIEDHYYHDICNHSIEKHQFYQMLDVNTIFTASNVYGRVSGSFAVVR